MKVFISHHRLTVSWVFTSLLFLLVTPCFTEIQEKPRVRQFRVQRHGDEFTVTAVLKPAFLPEIEARILAGTPTTFEYFIFLKRVRWYWDNRTLAHAAYRHTVTYDTLRKTFKIVFIREGVDGILFEKETKSQQEMQEIMSSFKGTLTYPSSKLSRDAQYYVSIKASLTTRQVPSPWSMFLSNDFKTETSRKYFP